MVEEKLKFKLFKLKDLRDFGSVDFLKFVLKRLILEFLDRREKGIFDRKDKENLDRVLFKGKEFL